MFMKGKHGDAVVGFPMDNFETRKNKTEIAMGSDHDDLMNPHKDEDGENQYSIRYLFLDYCEYTSGHGPPRILASKQLIRKIFWFVLFVAALTVSLWQISTLFKKFEARPLATHVSIQHETSLDFPVITICNFNSIKLSTLYEIPEELRDDIMTRVADLKKSAPRRRKRATQGGPTSEPQLDSQMSEEEEEGFENPDALDSDYKSREELTMIMAQFDPEDLIPYGHDFEDLVVSCTYRGISCRNFSRSYWSRYWHYTYGNCFVFNGYDQSGNGNRVLKSNKPGPSHGLVLELNIQQGEYLGAFTEEAGVKIDISNRGEMPFPREKGLSAAPGFATSIGMRKVEINRKDPFNNGRCFQSASLDDANLYKRQFKVGYSATSCKESCLAFNQRKDCKCMEYRFPRPSRSTPICNILNKKTVKCLSRLQIAFKRNELNCTKSCPSPCRENLFKLTPSFASWPSDTYQYFSSTRLEEKDIEFSTIENITSYLRSNVLKLNIFYEELNYEVIREERSYELANFVSDIGGSLGLWIGMSVLSFAEVLELILLIAYALYVKLRRKLRGRIRSSSQIARK